jgi:hypothetical protein
LISLTIEALKEEDKNAREQARTIARQESEIERLRVAVHAAEAQLVPIRCTQNKSPYFCLTGSHQNRAEAYEQKRAWKHSCKVWRA